MRAIGNCSIVLQSMAKVAVAMRPIRRILVPIGDLQSRSRGVVDKAAQLAEALGADIELFHDIATRVPVEGLGVPGYTLRGLKAASRRGALDALERIGAPLRARGLKVSTGAVWDYPPHEAIVRRAVSIGAGLIVAPRRDRHRFAQILGYTDWELLRLSPIPVLLVKSTGVYSRPVVLAAIDPMHLFAKSSALDQRILEQGTLVSRALRGSLHVVHAYQPSPRPPPPPGVRFDGRLPARILQAVEHQARMALNRALAKTAIPPGRRHLVLGHPSAAIPAAARKIHSSIVVIGAVSRSGLNRLFIGNTAEEVIDDLRCDLLVVKPARFSSRIARARRGVQFVSTE